MSVLPRRLLAPWRPSCAMPLDQLLEVQREQLASDRHLQLVERVLPRSFRNRGNRDHRRNRGHRVESALSGQSANRASWGQSHPISVIGAIGESAKSGQSVQSVLSGQSNRRNRGSRIQSALPARSSRKGTRAGGQTNGQSGQTRPRKTKGGVPPFRGGAVRWIDGHECPVMHNIVLLLCHA